MNNTAGKSLNIAVLTISDSRNEQTDTSGQRLVERLQNHGHQLATKQIVPDNRYRIRAIISAWVADEQIDVIITNGGTGLTGHDGTPEAITPLFDKTIEGFGEIFRFYSIDQIGPASVQSRAVAGVANGTYVFCLPGSTQACELAWDRILQTQLDSNTQPCNFANLIARLKE